jgi:cupin 2 domain-containing protein
MPNIFAGLPAASAEEQLTDLLTRPGLRIERIVSTGQASPTGFWYDQAHDEWVILLRGAAGLAIEGEAERRLAPGDYVYLPAHTRHRVTRTDAAEPTVWLAVHAGGDLRTGSPSRRERLSAGKSERAADDG